MREFSLREAHHALRCYPHIHARHDDFLWDVIIVGPVAVGGGGGAWRVCGGGVCEFGEGRGGQVFVLEDDEFGVWRVVVEDWSAGVEGGGGLGLVLREWGE